MSELSDDIQPYLLTFITLKSKKRHVHLDVVARYPFGVAAGVNSSTADAFRQASQIMADKGPINARTGSLDSMVTLEIPSDSLRPEMVNLSEMKDLFDYLR